MRLLREDGERVESFKRNNRLEGLLSYLNDSLQGAENTALGDYAAQGPDYPIVLVMGPPRCGSTLFTQWLANSGVVAYPTNLLSRFYGAPVIGALIQLMLTDPRYNFRDELLDFKAPIAFASENGKTKGVLAPNEFWYFWRRFLPFGELDWLPDEELFRVVDRDNMVRELTAITRVFGKPFALKGMIFNYNIPFLDAIFKKVLFVQLKRDPVTNVASILDARKRQMGSKSTWYSFKIPEYPQLKDREPIIQSSGQLCFINAAVTRGMATVKEFRKMIVHYETFCREPQRVFAELVMKLGIPAGRDSYHGPQRFKPTRNAEVPNRDLIEKALSQFTENNE